MSIESINTSINAGTYQNYKSNVEVPSSPEAPEIEKPELQNVELMSTKAAENFSDESEEQKEKLESAIEKLNKTAKVFNRSLKFKMHEATHRTMISVIDTDTDKVIRELHDISR